MSDTNALVSDVLEVVRKKKAGIKTPDSTSDPKKKTKEQLFFEGRAEFICGENQKLFSEVFGWQPTTVPNIPVSYYSLEYWNEKIRARVPVVNKSYYLHPATVESIAYSMYCKGTMLLHGPTGTGKTSITEQLCARMKIPFFRVSCHGQMDVADLLGSKSVVNDNGTPITKSNDTDVTLAAKHGGTLCLDEVFRLPPECLMSLQSLFEFPHKLSLLDAHGTDTVLDVPLDDFKLVLTDNTTGNGSATGAYVANAQDQSTQNRIRKAILIDYLPPNEEKKILIGVHPDVPATVFDKMLIVAKNVRKAFNAGEVQHTVSIRELLSWAESIENLRDIKQAFEFSFYDRLEEQDKPIVSDMFEQVYGVSI